MKIPNNLYNILKWLCLIALPALSAFLGVLLPAAGVVPNVVTLVLTIIGATVTFIGSLIGISTINYNEEKEKLNDKS